MDDDVITIAKQRFQRCLEAEERNREKQRDDIRFAAASPDDPWQWQETARKARETSQRPCLTINKLPQHIRQVTNDVRQNRPSIRFRPADDKADPEVADILMGLIRHIEANSDADIAYDTATEHQVTHGEGFIRVVADYIRDDSFDQDIFIRRVKRPFQVHMDPDIEDPAGSDAEFAFVEESLTEEEFKREFPKAEPIDWTLATKDSADWFTEDKKVRICEYFEVVHEKATLLMYQSGATAFEGDPAPVGVLPGERPIKKRSATRRRVVWRKINGQEVIDERDFPSRYIPIARVVGNEWVVDGKTIVSGIVRSAKDSQRMYNIAQSAIVERVMQAPKAPWAAPAAAVEGYEPIWQTANTANHSFLPYNHVDEQGNPIPSPVRVQPATVETGLQQIAMGAADDIKSETGQFDASLGQKSNETSGKAIMARQREGDTATYHYIDNLARAVRHVGRIVLDMLPKIYDTKRVARIVGEDNETKAATLDPQMAEPLTEWRDEQGALNRIFNPFVGVYDVYATTGPSFTTRRVEAVEAMTQMTQANPMLWQVIGDQLVKNMDWPGAEDMAERLKAVLLPQVQQLANKDDAAPQIPPEAQNAMQQMGMQLQQLQQALQNAAQHNAELMQQVNDKGSEQQTKLQEAAMKRDAEIVKAQAEVEKARIEAQAAAAAPQDTGAQQVLAARLQGIEQLMQVLMKHEQEEEGEELQEIQMALQQMGQVVATLSQQVQMSGQPKPSTVRLRGPDGDYVGEKIIQDGRTVIRLQTPDGEFMGESE